MLWSVISVVAKGGSSNRKIRQNAIGTSPLKSQQGFHHDFVMIQPAIGCCGFKHGVFATDLIGKSWHAKGIFNPPDNIQIRHTGLDHHHIGTLLKVGTHFPEGLINIAGIHLVCHFVGFAQLIGRANRIAKWSIKGTGEFG